jgi:hypothetical protein
MSVLVTLAPGTTIGYDPAGGTAFANVVGVYRISLPGIEYSDVDTTELGSTNFIREFAPGFGNGGECTIDRKFDAAQLTTDLANRRKVMTWKLTLPLIGAQVNHSDYVFSGYFRRVGGWEQIQIDGDLKVTSPVVVKLTGDYTYTAGS